MMRVHPTSRRSIVTPDVLAAACSALGLLALTVPASGQSPERRGLEPVEQRVEDEEPLARSLRRLESGLSDIGQDSAVYRRKTPKDGEGSPRYYYIGRGVTAEFDRSQYIRIGRKGERIAQKIPPNTVFHIGRPGGAEEPQAAASRQQGQQRGERANASSSRRIDARVDARVRSGSPASAESDRSARSRSAPRRQEGERYEHRRASQSRQRAVLRAIDRAIHQSASGTDAAERD
jgi:hypothetical protein